VHIPAMPTGGLGEDGIRPHSLHAGPRPAPTSAAPILIDRHRGWRDGSHTVLGYNRDIGRSFTERLTLPGPRQP
jgi:hypothetical protein